MQLGQKHSHNMFLNVFFNSVRVSFAISDAWEKSVAIRLRCLIGHRGPVGLVKELLLMGFHGFLFHGLYSYCFNDRIPLIRHIGLVCLGLRTVQDITLAQVLVSVIVLLASILSFLLTIKTCFQASVRAPSVQCHSDRPLRPHFRRADPEMAPELIPWRPKTLQQLSLKNLMNLETHRWRHDSAKWRPIQSELSFF